MALPGGELLRTVVSSAGAALRDGKRQRVRHFEGRAHVAVRGLREGDLPFAAATKLTEDVERRLADLPGVTWAVANTVLGHVVVGTEGPSDAEEIVSALIEAVEAVEEAHGVEVPLPDHPLSGGAVRRAWGGGGGGAGGGGGGPP
ncbi:hypothetical protein ABT173_49025, partial [Streptomyces sp. NPDC001795]|uniref:hypothetical protein n=1 Tax=Streptomyces sp. NPDC001795 TaxID=3154525 RepID=UPI003321F40C